MGGSPVGRHDVARTLGRVLEHQLRVRPLLLVLGAPVVWALRGDEIGARFVLLAVLVWMPVALVQRRAVRRDRFHPALFGSVDLVVYGFGLLIFGPVGWFVAQVAAIVTITTTALTESRRRISLIVAQACATSLLGGWLAGVEPELLGAGPFTVLFMGVSLVALAEGATAEVLRSAETAAAAASIDPTTGLATRPTLIRFLDEAMASGLCAGVVVLRLDRLDALAGAFGREHAERRLRSVGEILQQLDGSCVAAVDGSTVAIGVARTDDDLELTDRFESRLRELADHEAFRGLAVHSGWALGPEDGDRGADLLQDAETAAREASEQGRTHLRAEPSDEGRARRLLLLDGLRELRGSSQLAVHFQPQIDVASRRIVGVEALARWSHPELGAVRPDEFIHLAEISDLLGELTIEIFDRAVAAQARWCEAGLDLDVSVNVSVTDLVRQQMAERLHACWARHGVDPRRIILEITETQTSTPADIDGTLRRLAGAGVRFAIDDFGTGFSSLLRVRDLPVTELKIDRAFVGSMLTSDDDGVIVESTLQLGRTLGLDVVAEGVEDEAGLRRLAELGCDRAQGFLVSPAVPPEDIPDLCRRWSGERVDHRG